jgi:hypothetical protein
MPARHRMNMHLRTVTRTIEADLEPDVILDILTNPKRIPEWAPVFADAVDADEPKGWRVSKGGSEFHLEVIVSRPSGTVDYLRDMNAGKRGGAYIRVVPRPAGGSVVVMTVPIAPGVKAENVATVLEQELAVLVEIGGPGSGNR